MDHSNEPSLRDRREDSKSPCDPTVSWATMNSIEPATNEPDPIAGWPLLDSRIDLDGEIVELSLIDQDFVIDRLVEENADLERRNPYFGLVWPSAIVLGKTIARRSDLENKSFLDLGCGPGLLGMVAAKRGARVTFADVMPECVSLVRKNLARTGLTGRVLHYDLRDTSLDLGTFDFIVASDVLYERPLANSMLEAIERLLRPSGKALLSDPMRPTAHEFAHHASRRGFKVQEEKSTIVDDGKTVTVRIFELMR